MDTTGNMVDSKVDTGNIFFYGLRMNLSMGTYHNRECNKAVSLFYSFLVTYLIFQKFQLLEIGEVVHVSRQSSPHLHSEICTYDY
jgi:hypothetical protein